MNLTTIFPDDIGDQMKAITQATRHGQGTETDSVKNSLMKTVSWQVIATTTTLVIGWILTGSLLAGGVIASIEFWAKLALYYAHERAWSCPLNID